MRDDIDDDDVEALCCYPTCARRTRALFCSRHRAQVARLHGAARVQPQLAGPSDGGPATARPRRAGKTPISKPQRNQP